MKWDIHPDKADAYLKWTDEFIFFRGLLEQPMKWMPQKWPSSMLQGLLVNPWSIYSNLIFEE